MIAITVPQNWAYMCKRKTTNQLLHPLVLEEAVCLPSSDSVRSVSLAPVASGLQGNRQLPKVKFE